MVTPVLSRARGNKLLLCGAGAFVLAVGLYTAYGLINPPQSTLSPVDLRVYMDGGQIVRQAPALYNPHLGSPLYDWGGYGGFHLKFTYTPFAAVAFALISFVPWSIAPKLSMAVNAAALVAAVWFTFGGLGYRASRVRLGATLLVCGAVFWTEPVLRTIYLGQINLVLMALIMWDLCQPGQRRWWKGFATGVAAGVKLVPLIFVPYQLITRRFREAAMTVAGFAFTVGAGFAVLPRDSVTWWFDGLFARGGRTGFTGWAGNQSLRAIITRFAGSIAAGSHPWVVAGVLVFAGGMLAAARLDQAGYPMPALMVTALTGLLISPISWDHHWVWIAPAVAVAGHYAVRSWRASPRASRLACAGWWAIVAFIVIVYAAWPDGIWERAQHLGGFSVSFLWLPPNTSPGLFVAEGDQRGFVEYHWHGLQLLAGNAFILAGVVLFVVTLIGSLLVSARSQAPVTDDGERAALATPAP